jgi:transformation/transcription domain-associated protein
MYGYHAMEVSEAFAKIKEQARAYLALGDTGVGLQVLNSQNLDYFQPPHQAEIFRLKGVCLKVGGRGSRAAPGC